MAFWQFIGEPFRYDGGADNNVDVDWGVKFTIRESGGREMTVNVEAVRYSGEMMTMGNARDEVSKHLAEEEPPSRIQMDRSGDFHVAST